MKNNKTGRQSQTTKVDDHYVVLTELGNHYLTHRCDDVVVRVSAL